MALRCRDGVPPARGEVEGEHDGRADGVHVGAAAKEEDAPEDSETLRGRAGEGGGGKDREAAGRGGGCARPAAQAAEWKQRGEGTAAALPPVRTLLHVGVSTYGGSDASCTDRLLPPPTPLPHREKPQVVQHGAALAAASMD